MIIYKLTAIIVLITIAFLYVLVMYYKGDPRTYFRHLKDSRFNIMTFAGLLVLVSIAMLVISGIRFVLFL